MSEYDRDFYVEYLRSDKWEYKRQQKAYEQCHTCERCSKRIEKGFHIHHKTYKRLGNELLSDLMFLCQDCHSDIHSGINIEMSNKRRKNNTKKQCDRCYYACSVKFKGAKGSTLRTVLWCNKYDKLAENVCGKFRKGSLVRLPKCDKLKKAKSNKFTRNKKK